MPVGQVGAAREQIGRQAPLLDPVAEPGGTTQLRPARQPVQPVSLLQPEFWVQAAPTSASPGQEQSVVSPA